ncbi:hypothetical protein DMN91_003940 [Ooceraea biroi]|uniref:Uncharacterized protein n=1 Tax=Ooceraea biroi TaxID=2015173 RepID=A0A3L8DTM2_OOCBI|nr:hypothetical protein DMN91_003940 [Ooceraea biroi]
MMARKFHRDSCAMFPLDESRARSTRYGNSQRGGILPLPLLVNKNYLTDVYGSSVSLNYTEAAFLRARGGFCGLHSLEGISSLCVEGSCETLDCNLGRPCLPESLIIALAHRGIKRKLVDRASWQSNTEQTDLALHGNFEITVVAATIPTTEFHSADGKPISKRKMDNLATSNIFRNRMSKCSAQLGDNKCRITDCTDRIVSFQLLALTIHECSVMDRGQRGLVQGPIRTTTVEKQGFLR